MEESISRAAVLLIMASENQCLQVDLLAVQCRYDNKIADS